VREVDRADNAMLSADNMVLLTDNMVLSAANMMLSADKFYQLITLCCQLLNSAVIS
jgi:hypothetical protein